MDKFTLKREYNKLIIRLQKADQYFNNEKIREVFLVKINEELVKLKDSF